jgi:phage repressor protein C with HTH and peptisase S24 domain
MSEGFERLREARLKAGYATATEAAKAMGVPSTAYANHENGWRGIDRAAPRYARFFRVSLEWLLTGNGPMRATAADATVSLPILGKVGAGASVYMPDDAASDLGEVTVSLEGDFVVEVEGISQYPRFQPGEKVIVCGTPEPISKLVGQYAVVQPENDGKRLLKKIRRGRRFDLWDLESHNDETIRDVPIIAAWRVKGLWLG